MDKLTERKKMVVAMEYVIRQTNNDELLNAWLMCGVADGDIKYGDMSTDNIEDYYTKDDNFKCLMSIFLRTMVRAYNDGGLYCGGIVSKDRSDYEEVTNNG